MLDIQRVLCGAYQENAYVVNGNILIDPGDGLEALLAACPHPRVILLTHGHFDHMLAAEEIQRRTGAPVYIHGADAEMLSDAALSMYDAGVASLPMPAAIAHRAYGASFENFRVIHTPGHTPGSVCLYDAAEGVLVSGDTLFRAGFGRTDLAGGSMSRMISSIRALFRLPAETVAYPGHGESTTLAEERGRYGW
jgi:glyoxylase-like metal-dependent hydrolase (beta-lactamase superfamily II)